MKALSHSMHVALRALLHANGAVTHVRHSTLVALRARGLATIAPGSRCWVLTEVGRRAAVPAPAVICLCGSTRFLAEFADYEYRESLAGNIVLRPVFNPAIDYAAGEKDPPEEEAQLDALHCQKIELADEILVLNIGGYVGDGLRRELAFARSLNKRIRSVEPLAES